MVRTIGSFAATTIFTVLASTSCFAATCSSVFPGGHVDDIANIDQRQPSGTCSVRNLSQTACQGVQGFRHWKPDSGSGFTECFFDPPSESATPGGSGSAGGSSGGGGSASGGGGSGVPQRTNPGRNRVIFEPVAPPNNRPYNRQDQTGADKSKPWFRLDVCNYSGDGEMRIAVALANHNNDRTKVVRGWWPVGDGGCRAILERNFEDWTSMEILVHAETKSWQWPRDKEAWTRMCIADYSPYQRTNTQPYNCRPEEKLQRFERMVVNKEAAQATVKRINFSK